MNAPVEFHIASVKIEWAADWKKRCKPENMLAFMGSEVRDGMHGSAPEDTGSLKKSLRWDTFKEDLEVEISANTYYALFVERGTSRNRAQPYILPGLLKEGRTCLARYNPQTAYDLAAGPTMGPEEAKVITRAAAAARGFGPGGVGGRGGSSRSTGDKSQAERRGTSGQAARRKGQ